MLSACAPQISSVQSDVFGPGEDVYVISPAVHAIMVGDADVVFCERTQRLSRLNATASLVWRSIQDGATISGAAAALRRRGASDADSRQFAAYAIGQWLRDGYVAPQSVCAALSGLPRAVKTFRVGGLVAELRCFGESADSGGVQIFDQFPMERSAPQLRLSVVRFRGDDFLFVEDTSLGSAPPRQTAPRLKAILTERYCRSIDDGFLAHGGLVSKNGKTLFITGAPGAGKTTLVLALTALGFAYGGDDIVHVQADGGVAGVAFSAAVKSGSWPLLAPHFPGLSGLPIHERLDGQLTRYLTPQNLDANGARPIDVFVSLRRETDTPAQLQPISPLDALCMLLESGYCEQHAATAGAVNTLASVLSRAACYRLAYDRLDGAAEALDRCVHE